MWQASIAATFARRSSSRSDRSASAIASLVNRSKRSIDDRAAAPQGQGSLTKLLPLNHVDDLPRCCMSTAVGRFRASPSSSQALPDVTHQLVDAHRRAADRDPESTAVTSTPRVAGLVLFGSNRSRVVCRWLWSFMRNQVPRPAINTIAVAEAIFSFHVRGSVRECRSA